MSSHTAVVLLAGAAQALGCVSVPDPPPAPEHTARLAEQYQRPSAELEAADARAIASWAQSTGVMRYAQALEFLRSAIGRANAALIDAEDVTDTLHDAQGTLTATVGCPGHGQTALQQVVPPGDAGAGPAGSVQVTFGVDDSNIQSGFVGRVEACRISAFAADDTRIDLVITIEFQGELGADVPLGDELPESLLVLGTTGTIAGLPGGGDLPVNGVDFRLADGAREVLLEPAALGLAAPGSAVVVQRADASWAVRERRGTWSCGTGAGACVPSF